MLARVTRLSIKPTRPLGPFAPALLLALACLAAPPAARPPAARRQATPAASPGAPQARPAAAGTVYIDPQASLGDESLARTVAISAGLLLASFGRKLVVTDDTDGGPME